MKNDKDLYLNFLNSLSADAIIEAAYQRGYLTYREAIALKTNRWTDVEGRDVFIEDRNVIYVKDSFRLYLKDGVFIEQVVDAD